MDVSVRLPGPPKGNPSAGSVEAPPASAAAPALCCLAFVTGMNRVSLQTSLLPPLSRISLFF